MRIGFIIISLFLSVSVFAQTHEMVQHNGQKTEVNFIKKENNLLYYSLVGSSVEHKICVYAVAYLNDKKTSKSELISSKISVGSKNDFSKVMVLKPDTVFGLVKHSEFTGSHALEKGGTSFFMNENTLRKVKYKSAELGHPFVVLSDQKNGKYKAITYNY